MPVSQNAKSTALYAPGAHALCHVGDDDGRRAALILALREAHVP